MQKSKILNWTILRMSSFIVFKQTSSDDNWISSFQLHIWILQHPSKLLDPNFQRAFRLVEHQIAINDYGGIVMLVWIWGVEWRVVTSLDCIFWHLISVSFIGNYVNCIWCKPNCSPIWSYGKRSLGPLFSNYIADSEFYRFTNGMIS